MTDATILPASPERDWMTTNEFNAWFDRLGLPEKELARRLEVTQPTINRWRSGPPQGRLPPPFLWRALEHLEAELKDERHQRSTPGAESSGPEAAEKGEE